MLEHGAVRVIDVADHGIRNSSDLSNTGLQLGALTKRETV